MRPGPAGAQRLSDPGARDALELAGDSSKPPGTAPAAPTPTCSWLSEARAVTDPQINPETPTLSHTPFPRVTYRVRGPSHSLWESVCSCTGFGVHLPWAGPLTQAGQGALGGAETDGPRGLHAQGEAQVSSQAICSSVPQFVHL